MVNWEGVGFLVAMFFGVLAVACWIRDGFQASFRRQRQADYEYERACAALKAAEARDRFESARSDGQAER